MFDFEYIQEHLSQALLDGHRFLQTIVIGKGYPNPYVCVNGSEVDFWWRNGDEWCINIGSCGDTPGLIHGYGKVGDQQVFMDNHPADTPLPEAMRALLEAVKDRTPRVSEPSKPLVFLTDSPIRPLLPYIAPKP